MKRIAIFYSSKEGQTERIANRMAASLRAESNTRVTVLSISDHRGKIDWLPYDGVIVGGSVHAGHHAKELVEFIDQNRSQLQDLPSAFFSVSLSAAGRDEERMEARKIVENFLETTKWSPDQTEIFAGALHYRRYNFIVRWIMRRISGMAGGDTDTSRDHEYTNWNRVKRFTLGYLKENFA